MVVHNQRIDIGFVLFRRLREQKHGKALPFQDILVCRRVGDDSLFIYEPGPFVNVAYTVHKRQPDQAFATVLSGKDIIRYLGVTLIVYDHANTGVIGLEVAALKIIFVFFKPGLKDPADFTVGLKVVIIFGVNHRKLIILV